MNTITGYAISILLFLAGIAIPNPVIEGYGNYSTGDPTIQVLEPMVRLGALAHVDRQSVPEIIFGHGNIEWLPELALEAGWPKETHEKLSQVILRESGGCPNRKGGDIVNKNCYITGVSEWNHRSDTGLLQINGVNYDPKRNKWAIACRVMKICTQDPLLDPVTNLRVGYLMYQDSGWDPWDPCSWDKTRCPKTQKP